MTGDNRVSSGKGKMRKNIKVEIMIEKVYEDTFPFIHGIISEALAARGLFVEVGDIKVMVEAGN